MFEVLIDTWIDANVVKKGMVFESYITENNKDRITRYLKNGVIRRFKPLTFEDKK
jgi:hypothetical protein